ncbi:hypothetical protein [Halosimplex sp. TS25]|uniref:hypothetical protein n=1 Tax=Halosimplex rarum TaxID=3396619 RepID=UPI0039EB0AEC
MGGFSVFTGFLSTLFATLIGVIVAFFNDRQINKAKKYQRTRQHLLSVQEELKRNRETVNHNIDVISHLQSENGGNTSHYSIDVLSDDSWQAALEEGVIDSLDTDLYKDLNEIYYQVEALNELIRRLRTESIHPSLGEELDKGAFDMEIWSITVTYWDEDAEEIREADLATVIKKRSNSLGIRIDGVSDEIKTQLDKLEASKESAENRSLKRFQ